MPVSLAASLPDLTFKQREVLALVADNRTSKEIAARLGISESAVNQRIESVRTRLGGIPRGELARLYRQSAAPDAQDSDNQPHDHETWQKIYLPSDGAAAQVPAPESISFATSGRWPSASDADRDGSRLSEGIPGRSVARRSREGPLMAFARASLIAIILLAGMAVAFAVTTLLAATFAAG